MADDKVHTPAIPDITSAYISGDTAAVKAAIHGRVVSQMQGYVNSSTLVTGKIPVSNDKK